MVTQARLKELLNYDPGTGVFTWRVSRGPKPADSVAGVIKGNKYIYIGVDGKTYLAHRLAWLYAHGIFPLGQVDHANRIKTDNRIENLRLATQAENMQNLSKPRNNTSGVIGVSWDKQHKKWRAQIMIHGRQIYLGLYETIDGALAARYAAKEKYHTFNPEDNNVKTA